MEYPWRNIGSLCEHCGEPIEQRPVNTQGLLIVSGFEPMEYRHANNKEQVCVRILRDKVRTYDGCGQYEKYHKFGTQKVTCPSCASQYAALSWVTPTNMPEYQVGHCEDCGETWNECARNT